MRASTILLVVLAISTVLSIYAVTLGIRGESVSEGLNRAWIFAFALLVTFWARTDAASQKVHRTLDFSFYFLVFWPVALPYYLIKIRGTEGVIFFIGFATLYWAPSIFGLVAYSYWSVE